jgi:hypothetical protein
MRGLGSVQAHGVGGWGGGVRERQWRRRARRDGERAPWSRHHDGAQQQRVGKHVAVSGGDPQHGALAGHLTVNGMVNGTVNWTSAEVGTRSTKDGTCSTAV